ncbi:tissue factor pathway inhibitor-like isoform X2 [Seriola lalandi dorsalis]|uniref:tissue factor pathway inhibitor-like isoform X2 n=1 Tax=Seriola lalandi dorsalis TaxID=1841481 RepID=UPI000C6FCBD2|nr:tissue factor pathway inhibitor-like isoform X2 [Seriola lalandi dorsalis]XP_056244988.1 tissue factor pathway inhibitor a isoform X2 [Seriola aureovittata]
MALSNKWWLLCAVSLSCVARLGSCRGHGQDGAQPELFIFNELCALKDEPGPCKAIKDRFFFNVDTGLCELFEYGGCGGNDNNFETLESCEEMCVVSEDKNPCHLPEAPGPCRGLVKRYFFDSKTQQCKHFFYGGCFGNANNFRSMARCQAKCQNPVKPTKAPEVHTQPPRKFMDVQPTMLTGELSVSELQVQLNDSNQQIKELKPKDVCGSPVDRGTCRGAEKRFAFNPNTKRCQLFHYSGCGGNENNFTSRKQCIKKCIRSRNGHLTKRIRIRRKNIGNIVHRSV